jgi:hypothetical protein
MALVFTHGVIIRRTGRVVENLFIIYRTLVFSGPCPNALAKKMEKRFFLFDLFPDRAKLSNRRVGGLIMMAHALVLCEHGKFYQRTF